MGSFSNISNQDEVDHTDTRCPLRNGRGPAQVQLVCQGKEDLPWGGKTKDPLCRWLLSQVPLGQDRHLQAKVEEVCRQIKASEAVRNRKAALSVDHQEQEEPVEPSWYMPSTREH